MPREGFSLKTTNLIELKSWLEQAGKMRIFIDVKPVLLEVFLRFSLRGFFSHSQRGTQIRAHKLVLQSAAGFRSIRYREIKPETAPPVPSKR